MRASICQRVLVYVPVGCAYSGVHVVLISAFHTKHLAVIVRHGIDLRRLASFISHTRAVGGTVARLTLHLANYIYLFGDDSDSEFLISSVAYGVDMDYAAPAEASFYRVPNYVHADHVEKVDAQLRRELREGRIVPISVNKVIGVSAIGSVPKGKDGIRIISDYSRPLGQSVNSSINLRKESFAKASDASVLLRPKALHCKVDITDAYRSFPMAESWWGRHVFEWEGVLYSDLRMPFGNAGAPSAFHRFSMAFARLIKSRGFPAVVAYLDDFWLSA
jgi:hypothetical protein